MWLNRSGANADRRFIGFQILLEGRTTVADGGRASASNCHARSDPAMFRPALHTDLSDSQACGPSKEASSPGKLLNLHRMKDFRPGPDTVQM